MPSTHRQQVRVLPGRYVLERLTAGHGRTEDDGILAVVRGPDGGACMRRQRTADGAPEAEEAWIALWNGDEAHPPDATGMLAAIVTPLAEGGVPVWVSASFDGDVVLVPAHRIDEAADLLGHAGHRVIATTPGR